jgi:hypothetical protein
MTPVEMHIENILNELYEPEISMQRRRHLEIEIYNLKNYQKNNPKETKIPSTLELFCDSNPNAPECKIYEN